MPAEPHDTDDEQLVQRCRDGDRQAFAVLVERHWDRLYGWLYRLTWSTHTAEDLTQEVFLKAWSALPAYTRGPGFRAWLFRIARNARIDHVRRGKLIPTEPLPPAVPGPTTTPLEQLLCNEQDSLIRKAIDQLPDEYREALLLRSEKSLSFAEIGDILGAKEDTVRWRVYKARQILLKSLAGTHSPGESPS